MHDSSRGQPGTSCTPIRRRVCAPFIKCPHQRIPLCLCYLVCLVFSFKLGCGWVLKVSGVHSVHCLTLSHAADLRTLPSVFTKQQVWIESLVLRTVPSAYFILKAGTVIDLINLKCIPYMNNWTVTHQKDVSAQSPCFAPAYNE